MIIYIFYYMGIVFRMNGEQIIQLKDTYITEFARKIASDSGALLMQLFISCISAGNIEWLAFSDNPCSVPVRES